MFLWDRLGWFLGLNFYSGLVWVGHLVGWVEQIGPMDNSDSAAVYCAPVWSRSAHTSQVDVQLNSTMQLISGTLCSTPLPWLPVLSNIEPPALRRKAATDKVVEKIVRWSILT